MGGEIETFQAEKSLASPLPETNIASENGWLEDEFPFVFGPIFRGYVKLPGSNIIYPPGNESIFHRTFEER